MKKITLLFLTIFFCATLLLGQPGKALRTKDPGHRIHLVLNEKETEKIPVLNFYRDLQEGFEGYSDFETDLSPWFNVDVDGADTYGITDHTFPNNGEPMSFIVFNPDEVSPSMTDDPAIQPHTGEKFAACFSSIPPPYNNDWLITPPLDLGANSELSFWVKSYTDSYGLERYNVGVSTTGTNPEDFIIISGPTPMLAPADNWEEQTYDLGDYNGQTVYVGIQCVSEDAFIFMVDDVSVTWEQGGGNSTLSGKVIDATNDEPVTNALVSVGDLTDMTDDMGNYTIEDIPAGLLKANFSASPNTGVAPLSVEFSDLSTENTHTVNCTADGYIPYENKQVVIPDGGNLELDIPMSPEIAAGQMRLVLSWGSFPEDLDAHLMTPEISGQTWEVYYDYQGSLIEAPYAFLDNDDVNGFGPETITIADFFPGTYKYFIFNYDEDASVTVSNAAVKIYDDTGLKYDLEVPATGDGFYWYVCDINGSNKQVTIKNQILDAPPGNARSLFAPPKKKSENLYSQRDVVSWNWDFGDGSNSTDQNPTHVYENDGTYDVSLTVSDGTNQNTATKQNYIIVGELGIDDHLYDDAVVYPNPADGFLKIHSEKMIRTLILTDSKGGLVFRKDISSKEYILSTESMAPGLYLLRFEGESGSGSRKILVR